MAAVIAHEVKNPLPVSAGRFLAVSMLASEAAFDDDHIVFLHREIADSMRSKSPGRACG